jgi:hypothetical protein
VWERETYRNISCTNHLSQVIKTGFHVPVIIEASENSGSKYLTVTYSLYQYVGFEFSLRLLDAEEGGNILLSDFNWEWAGIAQSV